MKILIIEDEPKTAAFVKRGFIEEGFVVDIATDGIDGLHLDTTGDYDVVVLDIMLPKRDGWWVLQEIRKHRQDRPVILLTALDDVSHRVKGLNSGADDYLVKPFAFSELLARVEGLGRRSSQEPLETKLKAVDLEIDLLTRAVTRGGQIIPLQPREFKLLEYLMRNAGHIVTRTMLLENVWDYHFDPQTNVIDVHVSRLRGKIDKGFDEPILQTVRGAGYMIRDH